MSPSLSFPHQKQSQDVVSSQGAGGAPGAVPANLWQWRGGRSAHCTQTHPEASHQPVGWVPAQADLPEVSQPGDDRVGIHTQVAGPRVSLAQKRYWLILWLWKEHSPLVQGCEPLVAPFPSPQGGSRWEGGP